MFKTILLNHDFLGLADFDQIFVTVIGEEENYGPQHRQSNLKPRDVALWMSVKHKDKKALDIWSKEIASSGTGMAPGKCLSTQKLCSNRITL